MLARLRDHANGQNVILLNDVNARLWTEWRSGWTGHRVLILILQNTHSRALVISSVTREVVLIPRICARGSTDRHEPEIKAVYLGSPK